MRGKVSIHALLAECDRQLGRQSKPVCGFNPRTPCGVRLSLSCFLFCFLPVSIHALLAECDLVFPVSFSASFQFQSTHSLRSATQGFKNWDLFGGVSIHALLAECDGSNPACPCRLFCFNPRTPCGVRQEDFNQFMPDSVFQSTHSLRSATASTGSWYPLNKVSIHALLAECDL